jgi:hypothetical protein
MSEHNASDQIKAKEGIVGNQDIRTQLHAVKLQFVAVTWAEAKEENKNKDASGAANRRRARAMSYLTALRVPRGTRRTGSGARIHRFEGLTLNMLNRCRLGPF